MSGTKNSEETKEHEVTDGDLKEHVESALFVDEQKDSEKSNENAMPSPQQEEEVIKKKYGGIIPKKTPLIAKDHERAFFDSADWALGKGSPKPKAPLEALLPKLQPTTHQQVRSRHSAHGAAGPADEDDIEDGGNNKETSRSSVDTTTSKDLSASPSSCMM